jgi:transcriptional regulator with XRE-family HTH domain
MGGENKFGDLLRRHRLAAELTQANLAERAGLSFRGLSDIERGLRATPHRETIGRLAHALHLDEVNIAALHEAARRRGDPEPLARRARGSPAESCLCR